MKLGFVSCNWFDLTDCADQQPAIGFDITCDRTLQLGKAQRECQIGLCSLTRRNWRTLFNWLLPPRGAEHTPERAEPHLAPLTCDGDYLVDLGFVF